MSGRKKIHTEEELRNHLLARSETQDNEFVITSASDVKRRLRENIAFRGVGKKEVLDAFTGGPLEGDVFKCQECSARYGRSSVDTLMQENDGRCLCCNKKAILKETE